MIPGKSVFNEDIVLAGEAIIAYPCVVYSITLINDSAAAAIVNLSNSTTYSSASKVLKASVAVAGTTHLTFPKGLILSAGLSAAANAGSIDIGVTFD